MSDIEWEEPRPPLRGKKCNVTAFVEALRERPGEWAVYRRNVSSATGGTFKRYPGVEATSRKNPDRSYTIYARWVGDVESGGE